MWWVPLAVAGAKMVGQNQSEAGEAKQINRNIAQANQSIDNLKGNIGQQGAELSGMAQESFAPFTQNAPEDLSAYRGAIMSGSGLGYEDAPDFNYNLQNQAQQFLDPSMDFQIEQATEAVEGSAANAGKLFSGATGQAIANQAQDIAQQSWKDAFQMALADRGFEFDKYESDIDRDRESVDFAQNQFDKKVAGLGNLAGMGADASMNLAQTQLGIKGDQFKGMNEADLAMINNIMGQQRERGFFETNVPLVGGFLDSIF